MGNFLDFGTDPASPEPKAPALAAAVLADRDAITSMLTCKSLSTELLKRSRNGCLGPGVESSCDNDLSPDSAGTLRRLPLDIRRLAAGEQCQSCCGESSPKNI